VTHRAPHPNLRILGTAELGDMAALLQFPGWLQLCDHYHGMIDAQKKAWGEAVYKGEIPDEREAAFRAGFWEGVQAILDTPSKAETRLVRELQQRKEPA